MIILSLAPLLILGFVFIYMGSGGENVSIVYWVYLDNVKSIVPADSENNAKPLPDSLVIPKGNYFYAGNSYQLKDEGLYRFANTGIENQQRIVYDKNIDSLLSSIAWIYSHGSIDNSKTTTEIYEKAMHSKIIATCGKISGFIETLLDEQGVKSRIVTTLTLDDWNTYDNGHTMIEVFRDDYNKWVLYDLDSNVYFFDERPLSLIEFVKAVQTKEYEIRYLASDVIFDVNFQSNDGHEFSFYLEKVYSNEKSLREWYERVIQVPLIHEGDYRYFFNTTERERIEGYSTRYKFMDENNFFEHFNIL